MSEELLSEVAASIFAATCTEQTLVAAEHDGWPAAAWKAVAEAGLPWISVPENSGGQGGSLADALTVLRVAGRHAVPLPLAETGILAGWLLAEAGLSVGEGPATVVPGYRTDDLKWNGSTLSGVVHRVPWARDAHRIVALVPDKDRWAVAVVAPDTVRVEPRRNLAGEPRDTVHLDGIAPVEFSALPDGIDRAAFELRGALTRVVLIAGAVERILEITLRYTGERKQFGRPIGRFQAVQEHLVHLAQQSASISVAADIAAREAARGDGRFEIWSAKTLADDAVRIASAAAHQAHGAMGATQEYSLNHWTRRLWSWTREYGTATRWAGDIGAEVLAGAPHQLWPLITDGGAEIASRGDGARSVGHRLEVAGEA